MLYEDWDIVLEGENIRLTPITEKDSYGNYYPRTDEAPVDSEIIVKVRRILNYKDENEYHAIRLKDKPYMIGWIALQREENYKPEIGIYLQKEYQNKGYGREAVRLLLNRVHREYGIDRAYAYIMKKNLQSQKAFGKMGAVCFEKKPSDEEREEILAVNKKVADALDKITMCHYYIDLPIADE